MLTCFVQSDKLRRYYGDGISRLRSRLHAGILYIYRYGPLAQSREQRLCTPEVAGWIPAWSTIHDTGRLLNSGRPVFRTAHRLASPLPAPRAAPRAAGRAVRADCLPRTRSDAYDTTFSVHLQQDDTSRMADRFHLRQVFPYIPIRRKAGISISHHDESCFPPHAPHMRHGERGEFTAVCLPIRLVSTRYGGGDRHIPHRGNQIGRIRFCAFSVNGGFPCCHVPSLCYSINIPSERCSRPSLPG